MQTHHFVIRRFQLQEVPFCFKASGETGQVTRPSDDSVARNNDRNWIPTVCPSNSPTGRGFSKSLRDVAVTACFAKRNAQQELPYLSLKTRSPHLKRYRECQPLSPKILTQFLFRSSEQRMMQFFNEIAESNPPRIVVFPKNSYQTFFARNELEHADRRIYEFIRQIHSQFIVDCAKSFHKATAACARQGRTLGLVPVAHPYL